MKLYQSLALFCAFQPIANAFTLPSATKNAFLTTSTSSSPSSSSLYSLRDMWAVSGDEEVRIEGQTRGTWKFGDTSRESVEIDMKSEGRPMQTEIELWIGPDWTPLKMQVYSQDGKVRPIKTIVGTRNKCAEVEIRNTGPYEFPINAKASYAKAPFDTMRDDMPLRVDGKYVEGNSVHTKFLEQNAKKVEVLLKTDTRQLNAKIEILNGPNNVKQAFEVFTNNGLLNSFCAVLDLPGPGHTVRVTNIAPLEFPCKAFIQEI